MGAFEYLLVFAAVILGLSISDLAVSIHRLLNAAERVRWDVLAPLAAALAFERIVAQWWTWHAAGRIATGLTFGMFLGVLTSATLLFLLAAVALPDDVAGNIDLRRHFDQTRRRYWLLFAGQWIVWNTVSSWAQVEISGARLSLVSPLLFIPILAIALAFTPNRVAQGLGLIALLATYTAMFFQQTLL